MILYFLRHASAGQHFANLKKDEKRALDKEGIEQCGYIGRALVALDVQVDVIVTSPLKRCAQTAALVGNELGYEGKLQLDAGLRPEAGLVEFRKLLEKYSRQEAMMVVGHNPNLSQFLGAVISDSGCEASEGPQVLCSGASLPRCCARFTIPPSRAPARRLPENSRGLFRPPIVPGLRPFFGEG